MSFPRRFNRSLATSAPPSFSVPFMCSFVPFVPFVSFVLLVSQPPRYVERVDVTRVLIDLRVVDGAGRPIPDLEPSHFVVKIDGTSARIDSLQWIDGTAPVAPSGGRTEPLADDPKAETTGRLIVLLFQKDLEPSRIIGLMKMLIEWQPFVGRFSASDRIAVLSFDSHLNIWTDFTSDLERVQHVLEHGLLFERPPRSLAPGVPSLLSGTLTPERARRIYSIERALIALGEALKPLPGAKSLVLIGHGFGRFGRGGVTMENEYEEAKDALVAARASVFSLDVTQADYHSLEVGLQLVSEQTGGFYASTFHFPNLAIERVAGALAGYYVLFIETRRLKPGPHRLDVDLKGRRGTILANSELVIW